MKAEDVPGKDTGAATKYPLWRGFSGSSEPQHLRRSSIGEFQNRPVLGTGAKRASYQDCAPSEGMKNALGKRNRDSIDALTQEGTGQILPRTHRTMS